MSPFFFRFVITLFALASFCTAVSAKAFLQGRIANANYGDRLELYVPHFYVDNDQSSYKVQLDSRLEFSIEVDVPEPQVVFILFGQDQMPIFLEPNDSLLVRLDMFQFPVMAEFGGRGAFNNRLLREFTPMQGADYNEFNNQRFKVGNWWFPLETFVNDAMLELKPDAFKAWTNNRQERSFKLYDQFQGEHPGALTQGFREWLESEILFSRGYQMVLYGSVYKGRHQVPDEFFEFLQELPMTVNAVGSEAYRNFLLVHMARLQAKANQPDQFFAGQYDLAGTVLEGKPLAYFRSEIIRMGFSSDRLTEILPQYADFMRNNTYTEFERKIVPLYERTSRFAPGMAVPSFAGSDFYTANNFSTESLHGKTVYLNFWATWCGACIKKMDIFESFKSELETANVVIVNISIDENADTWRTRLGEKRWAGLHILAKDNTEQSLARTFGVEAIPQYFIIDQLGRMAEKPHSNQVNEVIDRLIQMDSKK